MHADDEALFPQRRQVGMVDVTLLKLDLTDATFNAPFGGNTEHSGGDEEPAFDEEASRARGIAALVGLAFLVAGTLLVRRVVADDGEEEPAASEPTTVEVET